MTDSDMAPNVKDGAPKLKKDLSMQGDLKNATFSFNNEDHTLGNLLRN
jgi:DNA-directed RNA polymerase subunit L